MASVSPPTGGVPAVGSMLGFWSGHGNVAFAAPQLGASLSSSLRGAPALATHGGLLRAESAGEASAGAAAGSSLLASASGLAALASAAVIAGRRQRHAQRCRGRVVRCAEDGEVGSIWDWLQDPQETSPMAEPPPPNLGVEGEPAMSSDMNIDYTTLRDVLKSGDFKEADAETRRLLIRMSGEEAVKRGWIYWAEVRTIPDADMETLESLWQYFSEGKFGFVQQRKIWKKVRAAFDKYALEVSWFTAPWANRNWPDEFLYTTDAPVGHLPLTNCIRGAQVLDELLNHPVIERKKVGSSAPAKKKSTSSASSTSSSDSSDKPGEKKEKRSALSMLAHGGSTGSSGSQGAALAGATRVVPARGALQACRAVAASEVAPVATESVWSSLASIKECNVINESGFVLPEIPDDTTASVFVIFDMSHKAQYLGFSKDLRNSLRTLLCRRPELCYHYKALNIQAAGNEGLLEIRTAWIAELGGKAPLGNTDARQKSFWESPVDGGALSERAFKLVAEQKAKQIVQQLKDRGLKETMTFKEDLIADGKVDPLPSTYSVDEMKNVGESFSSRTRLVEIDIKGTKVSLEIFYMSELDTNGGWWFDVEITAKKVKSTHRVILGREFMGTLGAENPQEVVEKAFALLIAKGVPRKTEGIITSEVFPVNYFTVANLSIQYPEFFDLFDNKPVDVDKERLQWNFKQVHDYSKDVQRTIPAGPNGGVYATAAV